MTVIYVIVLILTLYYSYRYDGIEEYDAHKEHHLWLMCFIMTCVTGFSYGLGADKFVYMRMFDIYPDSFSEAPDFIAEQVVYNGMMPLWTIVNLFCKVVFDSFYAVQFIESAAINIAVCYVVSKHTHRYFLFLLIFFLSLQFFIFNTEVMREGFALAIMLIGMHHYLVGRRWVLFALMPFALLFHVSAAIVLLFPLARYKVSWNTLYIAFALSFGIWIASDLILSKVMNAIFGGDGMLVQKIMFYSFQASSIFGFTRAVFTYLIFPFIVMHIATLQETDPERRRTKERLTAFMVMLGVLASSFAGFSRLYNYVQLFHIILFTDFVYNILREKSHFIIRLGAFCGTVFIMVLSYFSHYDTTDTYFYDFFYPYTCILDETDDVFIRELAHYDAVTVEVEDNNVRNIE